jgi:hypothetical protein
VNKIILPCLRDRAPESFAVTGPDDYCTTELWVEANATVEVGASCA